MKKKTILIAAIMCLAFSAAAFAQATFTVGSIPVTAVANSGQTEKTGDITITTIPLGSATVTGTITINYGIPITVTKNDVVIFNQVGTAISVLSVNNAAGQLSLAVAAGQTQVNAVISGVRVATAGTSLTSLAASISTTGNALVSGQTDVKVINSIVAGLASFAADLNFSTFQQNPILINAITGAPSSATLNVVEGFLDAFGATASTDMSQTDSKMLRIKLSELPPTGVTISFPQYISTYQRVGVSWVEVTHNAFQALDSDGNLASAAVSVDKDSETYVYYQLVADTNPTISETARIPVSASVAVFPSPLPLPQISLSATVTLAPVKAAFMPGTFTPYASPIPRYAAAEVGPASLLRIYPSSTTLLIPFATTAFGYNTGIAVANTTKDPGISAMGFAGASAQTGKIVFYFYPRGAAAFSVSTLDHPNTDMGTDASGKIPAGGLYAITLSELLEYAGKSGDFNGYIIAVCDFSNAHGQYFVSDFEYFTNGAQALVIPGARSASVVEALAQ